MQFIEAQDKNIATVLYRNRYRIDSFQREYRWQRKHIEALISDLSSSFEKNFQDGHSIEDYNDYNSYYMGPIVLCDDKKSLSIVDGQQRLTSFTLLLIYLHHAQKNLNLDSRLSKDLNQFLYVNKGGKTTLVLNVESRTRVIEHLYNNPDTVFEDLDILQDQENPKLLDESIRNIIERYEDITKLFPNEINNEEKLPIFIEWLLDKVVMVEVKAYSMENAYTIFETMNDRGLSLNPTEILKGYLLSKIDDDEISDEMNEFWKERIVLIKSSTSIDGDLDFFRAWLRAKYAETKRTNKQGSENEDFELIGTQFNSWVKNNPEKTYLKKSEDYYQFINSDFSFYSSLYLNVYSYKNSLVDEFENFFITNFYPIADSLSYPLYLSSISKIDDEYVIETKLHTVNKFIDIFTNVRALTGRALTQSTIRNYIYDLIKNVRNVSIDELKLLLNNEIDKLKSSHYPLFSTLNVMDNWGYYHYFYARILHYLNPEEDFQSLLRSRKQSSLVLHRIFNEEDFNEVENSVIDRRISTVANFCLIKRYQIDEFSSIRKVNRKIAFLKKYDYLPEIDNFEIENTVDFIDARDSILCRLTEDIWNQI